MHINMKYYVVSIGAIFIALGIGILVGFNLNYDQELSEQQAQIINDLEKEFESLKDYNDGLEKELKKSNSDKEKLSNLIEGNIEVLVKDVLIEENIGIISSNNTNKESIDEIAKYSGLNILFDISINTKKINEEALNNLSSELDLEISSYEQFIQYVSSLITEEDSIKDLRSLEETGMITINKLEDNYIDSSNILMSLENNEKYDQEGLNNHIKTLNDNISKVDKSLIAIDAENSKNSNIEVYIENGVSTIDNINNGLGKVSLVKMIKDDVKGNFGTSISAQSIIAS